jgi:hypothetical protein
MSSYEVLIELVSFMEARFNSVDLEQLCFRLAVNHEDIPGANRQAKIRELVQYMDRHIRLWGKHVQTQSKTSTRLL